MDALAVLEREGDVDRIVALFSESCDVGNAVSPNVFVGHDGARTFWSTYRAWFGEIASTFHTVIEGDGRTAIEWSSTGTNARGRLVAYDGVSVLEYDGDRIQRFRAYFNPFALGRAARTETLVGDLYFRPLT